MRKSGVSGRPLISVVAQSRCQSGEHSASGGRVGVARGVLSAIWKSKSGSIAIKIAARSSYGYGGSPDLPDTPAPTHAHAPTLHRNSIYIYDALLATGARGGDRLAQPNASHYVGLGAGGAEFGRKMRNLYRPSDGEPARVGSLAVFWFANRVGIGPYFQEGSCGLAASIFQRIGNFVSGFNYIERARPP